MQQDNNPFNINAKIETIKNKITRTGGSVVNLNNAPIDYSGNPQSGSNYFAISKKNRKDPLDNYKEISPEKISIGMYIRYKNPLGKLEKGGNVQQIKKFGQDIFITLKIRAGGFGRGSKYELIDVPLANMAIVYMFEKKEPNVIVGGVFNKQNTTVQPINNSALLNTNVMNTNRNINNQIVNHAANQNSSFSASSVQSMKDVVKADEYDNVLEKTYIQYILSMSEETNKKIKNLEDNIKKQSEQISVLANIIKEMQRSRTY